MASCEFAGGMKNVRGTLSKKTYRVDGKTITRRVVAQVTPSGKQRIFIRESSDYQRSTPVTEKELACRGRFEAVNSRVAALTEAEKIHYYREWVKAGYKFNGKRYATLRGYMVARIYAEMKGE